MLIIHLCKISLESLGITNFQSDIKMSHILMHAKSIIVSNSKLHMKLLKCPYYESWKVHILVWESPITGWHACKVKKKIHCLIIWHNMRTQCCFVNSVTGETLQKRHLVAKNQLAFSFRPMRKDQQVGSNMLMFHVEVNMKCLGFV